MEQLPLLISVPKGALKIEALNVGGFQRMFSPFTQLQPGVFRFF